MVPAPQLTVKAASWPSLPVKPARATKLVTEIIGFSQSSFARKNHAGVATMRVFSTRGRKNEIGHDAAGSLKAA